MAAKGAVQVAFNQQADWAPVFENWTQHETVQAEYGSILSALSAPDQKILAAKTLVPLAKAKYAANPKGLLGKRSGILNGYRDFAEKKGIEWRKDAASLESRGTEVWEQERLGCRQPISWPDYYLKAGYHGALHSYNNGNGEWMAAFDAPSAYLLVHLHHYPDKSPQDAFDALHAELDSLALNHLESTGKLRCLDVGCGVGTSTFSTARSLAVAGRDAAVTGVDLSDYFIAVGRHLAKEAGSEIQFVHGNGLALDEAGFKDASVDLVTISEVTHEMPVTESRRLLKEAARVLKPGGVLAYLDLNQVQILQDNPVGALVDRIATCNEPYFDEYLELKAAQEMRDSGLEVMEETWPNKQKYETFEKCSLRIIIAKKSAQVKNGAPAVNGNGYPA